MRERGKEILQGKDTQLSATHPHDLQITHEAPLFFPQTGFSE